MLTRLGPGWLGVRVLVELATRLTYAGSMTREDGDLRGVAPATPGRVVDASKLDLAAAERATRDLFRAIGADADAPDLLDTPRRVAASFAELLTPAEFGATVFPNEGYDELVLVRDISFRRCACTTCCRSMASRTSAYLPGDSIIGLSKLARVVEILRPGIYSCRSA